MSNLKIQGTQKKSIVQFLLKPFQSVSDNCKISKRGKGITSVKKSDGHPVIIIPGYTKGDRSVKLLNRFLKKNGYNVDTWKLADEIGKDKNFNRLSEKIERLYEKTNEPISLIGWSLGGLYARLLAKKHPEKIRQIITLSAPFNGVNLLDNAEWWFSLIYGGTKFANISANFWAKMAEPAPVPTTAVFSKEDTLVAWKTCIEKVEDEWHQNIEIKGNHVDVLFNHEALIVILDRLTFKRENWQNFKKINWLPLPFGNVS